MTNRLNPTTTDTPDEPTGPLAAILAVDPTSETFADDVTAIVREVRSVDRQSIVLDIGRSFPNHIAAVPVILNAPTGPDPRQMVRRRIDTVAEMFAALMLGASERGTFNTDDAPTVLAAALSRVTPDVELAAAAEKPATRSNGPTSGTVRRRRNISRDWSNVNRQTFYTPGRGGRDPVAILVTVSDGKPRFHVTDPAGDRHTFTTPTPALAAGDGWTADGLTRGWANPFVCLTDSDGRTLGERAPELAGES